LAHDGHSERRAVLIVDDNEAIRLLIRCVLENAGYEVVAEVGNGEDAVTAAAALHPDIVVLDEEMPTMNGSQAADRIRRADPAVRIVMCSTSLVEYAYSADASVSKFDVAYLPLTLDRVMA
jgi:two-component system chemotaxis response regulator CheY